MHTGEDVGIHINIYIYIYLSLSSFPPSMFWVWEPQRSIQPGGHSITRTEERARKCYQKAGFKTLKSKSTATWGNGGTWLARRETWTQFRSDLSLGAFFPSEFFLRRLAFLPATAAGSTGAAEDQTGRQWRRCRLGQCGPRKHKLSNIGNRQDSRDMVFVWFSWDIKYLFRTC